MVFKFPVPMPQLIIRRPGNRDAVHRRYLKMTRSRHDFRALVCLGWGFVLGFVAMWLLSRVI